MFSSVFYLNGDAGCNLKCKSCVYDSIKSEYEDSVDVINFLDRLVSLGSDSVIIFGKEPPLSRHFKEVIKHLTKTKTYFGFNTNGMIFDKNFEWELLKTQFFRYVSVYLPSLSAKNFQKFTGKNGLKAALTGILNFSKLPVTMEIVIPVHRLNIVEYSRLSALTEKLFLSKANILIRLTPLVSTNKSVTLTLFEVIERVKDLLTRWWNEYAALKNIKVLWENLPACLMKGYWKYHYGVEKNFVVVFDKNSHFPKRVQSFKCDTCSLFYKCAGIVDGYETEETLNSLSPIQETISNSFNFVYENSVTGEPTGNSSCPVFFKNRSYNFKRGFFLWEDKEKLDFYYTETKDVNDEEIFYLKNRLEQLYLDRSPDNEILEFSKMYQSLKLKEECKHCEQRNLCFLIFEKDSKDKVLEDQNLLGEVIRKYASGSVCDIGCGDQPFFEVINTGLKDGKIKGYTGIDPDREALLKVREKVEEAVIIHGKFEEVKLNSGFDTILMLRSFNHLFDIEKSMKKILDHLNSGGILIVSENILIPLARSKEQMNFVMKNLGRADFEHYRNWDSLKFLNFASNYPFEVIYHRPVTPETSFMWIAVLKKIADKPIN